MHRWEGAVELTVNIPEQAAGGRSEPEMATELVRLAVLEAFRRGDISSGRAAHLVGLKRIEFLEFAARRGIPTMNLDVDGLARELAEISDSGT